MALTMRKAGTVKLPRLKTKDELLKVRVGHVQAQVDMTLTEPALFSQSARPGHLITYQTTEPQ